MGSSLSEGDMKENYLGTVSSWALSAISKEDNEMISPCEESGAGPSIHLPTLLYVKANFDEMVSAELHLVRVSGADLAHHSYSWEGFLICVYFQVLGKWPEWTICFLLVLFKLTRNEEEKRTFCVLWEPPELFSPLFLISLNH